MSDSRSSDFSQESEDYKRRRELYDRHAEQAWTDQQASSDAFDNNLLTFSGGALGLSLAFIKDVVPLTHASSITLLFLSWIAFAVCIAATIASFWFGKKAQEKHVSYLKQYYLEYDDGALNKRSWFTRAMSLCTCVGSLCFYAGLVLTLIFTCENIMQLRRNSKMSDKGGEKITGSMQMKINDARFPAQMTAIPESQSQLGESASQKTSKQEERGRIPANMTAVAPRPQTQSQDPLPSSQNEQKK